MVELEKSLTVDEKFKLVPRLVAALKKYSDIFNNKKPQKKYKYIRPIKEAGFTKSEAEKFGFKVSKWLWSSSMNKERRKAGRPKLCSLFTDEIKNYFNNNCTIAANRYLKLQKCNFVTFVILNQIKSILEIVQ